MAEHTKFMVHERNAFDRWASEHRPDHVSAVDGRLTLSQLVSRVISNPLVDAGVNVETPEFFDAVVQGADYASSQDYGSLPDFTSRKMAKIRNAVDRRNEIMGW